MSGGSYDYLYSKSDGEKIVGIVRDLEALCGDLNRAMAADQMDVYTGEGDNTRHAGYRPLTDMEKASVAVAAAQLRSFAGKISVLLDQAQKFDDLLHDIEWFSSCDIGPGSLVDSCVRYVEKQLGVPLRRSP